VPAEKQRLILNALKEGISYSAITRTFNCSFSTIYALLKKP
jgi:transposase-like protein